MTQLPISVRLIMQCCAEAFDVSLRELRSLRRRDAIVQARQAVYLLARELTDQSFPQIGRALGRDHSSIIHGAGVARELIRTNPAFAERVDAARAAILVLARSELARAFDDPDAVACAERICADPLGQATRASVNDITALATRLLCLEDVAVAAFQLLYAIDELALTPPGPRAAHLRGVIAALTYTLSGALAALGYTPAPSTDEPQGATHEPESKDARREPARAAV